MTEYGIEYQDGRTDWFGSGGGDRGRAERFVEKYGSIYGISLAKREVVVS